MTLKTELLTSISTLSVLIELKPTSQLFDINDKVTAIRVLEQLKRDITEKKEQ